MATRTKKPARRIPPDPEKMNNERAAAAAAAVEAFQEAMGTDDGDAVCDLIADLHHLCDRVAKYGTFADALHRATYHYEAETDSEGTPTDSQDDTEHLRALLRRALPMLVQLGDHIGNGPIDATRPDSLGTRCDLIGDIRAVASRRPLASTAAPSG